MARTRKPTQLVDRLTPAAKLDIQSSAAWAKIQAKRRPTCTATARGGLMCGLRVVPGTAFCRYHQPITQGAAPLNE